MCLCVDLLSVGVCVDFLCGYVYVLISLCVGVCMCGFCKVWFCVCFDFVICECVYVWSL